MIGLNCNAYCSRRKWLLKAILFKQVKRGAVLALCFKLVVYVTLIALKETCMGENKILRIYKVDAGYKKSINQHI